MTGFDIYKSVNLNAASVLFQTLVMVLFCLLLLNTIESSENIPPQAFHNHLLEGDGSNKKLVCYYVFTNDFNPMIMEDLCTHINIGFLGINARNNSIQPSPEQKEVLYDIAALKKRQKDLKVLMGVGGAGEEGFISMVFNHKTRKMFIRSLIKWLKEFKIDGVDLDWEWPVVIDGNEKEKVKFIQLLHEIREEFDRHEKHYILSVDVSSTKAISELSYIVRYVAQYVDYVNVMCYDYHYFSKWFPFTGHNAPLYAHDGSFSPSFNVNDSIYYWISNSMPRNKIVVGLPTFGHTFKLSFRDKNSLAAPAVGYGSIGINGFANYPEICKFLKEKDTTVVYDNISKVPYAYNYLEWISFDNETSLITKASYIMKEDLGGAMVFSVNADDFKGSCTGNGLSLPLIRAVREILFNEV